VKSLIPEATVLHGTIPVSIPPIIKDNQGGIPVFGIPVLEALTMIDYCVKTYFRCFEVK